MWKRFIHTSLNSCMLLWPAQRLSAAHREYKKTDTDILFPFLHLHLDITERKKIIIIKSAIKKKFICAQFVRNRFSIPWLKFDIWDVIMKKMIKDLIMDTSTALMNQLLRDSERVIQFLITDKNKKDWTLDEKLHKIISPHFEYCA